jgi:hypothetical protein
MSTTEQINQIQVLRNRIDETQHRINALMKGLTSEFPSVGFDISSVRIDSKRARSPHMLFIGVRIEAKI